MLFRKEIEPRCVYCANGASIGNEQIACLHRGIVPEGYHCRRFVDDPLKRVPARPQSAPLAQHDPEEFKL